MKGKEISIDFDGIYMESEIYVNGTKVGEYQNGYTPFSFNIEDYLKFDGQENVIAVKVVNRQPSSRWYSGSGIYRNVYLTVTEPIHVDRYGTFVTTPTLEEDLKAGNGVNVNIKTEVNNTKNTEKTVNVKSKIFSPDGKLVSEHETNEVLSVGINNINHDLIVQNPTLWDVYQGNMYNVVTEVEIDGKIVDTYDTPFGFRYFEFDENKGFSLNGENMKLNGVCMHHDLGSLGSAVNYDAVERQILMLKDMGVNAIRITHNPASNEFIEICEREGMLLIDEAFDCWEQSKKTYDYGRFFNQYAKRDIQTMVDRGKNSPSIIMWSIGNEIYDTNNARGVTIAKNLVKWIKEIDSTRPTTIGEDKYRGNKEDGVANYHTYRDQVMDAVDVVGYNYSENVYDVHHRDNPERKIYGSEISSAVRSRGIYLDPSNPNISDYDNLQT
ncbi:MAG: glycoside hydrolase family 2 TIM barrel-domain containing protein, partial [Sarcina sp.]